MTPNILENISTWLVDWSLVTIMGNTTPPRDPNDENDEDDEDDEDDKDDKDDEDTRTIRTTRTTTRTTRTTTREAGRAGSRPLSSTLRCVYSATAFAAGEILPAFSRPSRF